PGASDPPYHSSRGPRDLHSFPTRRSSDLIPGHEIRTSRAGQSILAVFRPTPASSHQYGILGLVFPCDDRAGLLRGDPDFQQYHRSEEHTSELQSRENLVCRLLLEKKKKTT